MRFREDVIGAWRRGAAAVATLACLTLAACGGDDDFENEPRPAAPVNLSAAITKRGLLVSPSRVGAGVVEITITNQTGEDARVQLEGPSSAPPADVPAGGTGSLKANLERGSYTVSAEPATQRTARLRVGPPRPSSSSELLLP
ncbi:MAG TPA: hypothetical protein VIL04_04880 [Solirubrobacterales bacterium]|jgi:hypothetical protein